jgi:hypothetical protein
MSAAVRFAPMTSALLARKGEARPADAPISDTFAFDRRDVVLESSPKQMTKQTISAPVMTEMDSSERPDTTRFANDKTVARRRHSISLSLSDSEFEKLGLTAVKKRVNRQQLLRLAIDCYLEQLAQEYRSECQCISTCAPCSGGRTAPSRSALGLVPRE